MKVKGIVWLGSRTDRFNAMINFYQNVMGLNVIQREPGLAVIDLPNGDRVEVFGGDSPYYLFFTHPVAGFLVDDIASARAEMEAKGIEFITSTEVMEDGYAFTDFRAPDGFIYELIYDPKRQT